MLATELQTFSPSQRKSNQYCTNMLLKLLDESFQVTTIFTRLNSEVSLQLECTWLLMLLIRLSREVLYANKVTNLTDNLPKQSNLPLFCHLRTVTCHLRTVTCHLLRLVITHQKFLPNSIGSMLYNQINQTKSIWKAAGICRIIAIASPL
jgi:hypothetical protein